MFTDAGLHIRLQHLNSKVGFELLDFGRELRSFGDRVVDVLPGKCETCISLSLY